MSQIIRIYTFFLDLERQKRYHSISSICAVHCGMHTLLSHCYVIVCMPVLILMIIRRGAIIIMHAAVDNNEDSFLPFCFIHKIISSLLPLYLVGQTRYVCTRDSLRFMYFRDKIGLCVLKDSEVFVCACKTYIF